MASTSPPNGAPLVDEQHQQLLQSIDARMQQLEEERRELRRRTNDLEAERRVILAKLAAAEENDPHNDAEENEFAM